jgi:hypothetical protein
MKQLLSKRWQIFGGLCSLLLPSCTGTTVQKNPDSSAVNLLENGSAGTGGPPRNEPTADANCGSQLHRPPKGVADVLLVLDVSSSMSIRNTGATTRYQDVTTALDTVLPATDSTINWGLMLYPAADSWCSPGQVNVPVLARNAAAVHAFYFQASPGNGYTPTAKTIDNAVAALKQRDDQNPKYIVLATDGQPNCNPITGGIDTENAVASVKRAFDEGIPVFVIGLSLSVRTTVADQDAPAVLNQMAVRGGRPRSDPNTRYYAADESAQLVTAMTDIGNQIATCLFSLPSAPPVPDNVLVVYENGPRRLPGPATWNYADPQKRSIQLRGSDCDKVLNGTYKSVQILFGCPGDEQLIP